MVFYAYYDASDSLMDVSVIKFENIGNLPSACQRGYVSKQLVINAMDILSMGKFNIEDFKYTELGKPYILNGPYFSVSYSDCVTALAISQTEIVGIDIEKVVNFDLGEMLAYLPDADALRILDSMNSIEEFYTTWVQREALLKAIGTGCSQGIRPFDAITTDTYGVDKESFYLNKVEVRKGFLCYIATTAQVEIVQLDDRLISSYQR